MLGVKSIIELPYTDSIPGYAYVLGHAGRTKIGSGHLQNVVFSPTIQYYLVQIIAMFPLYSIFVRLFSLHAFTNTVLSTHSKQQIFVSS